MMRYLDKTTMASTRNEACAAADIAASQVQPRPAIVIAGTESGVGKTSLSLGLARMMSRSGLRVQTFKVGPDFLDPTYLKLASGRKCYNLDIWMMGKRYVRELFNRTAADADISIIEGVMGMYDGCRTDTSEGSTADTAACIGAPVILVCNVKGVARSLAATVKGFAEFENLPGVSGVIANRCGSKKHADMLSSALSNAGQPPLIGSVCRDAFPSLPSRHLGLITAVDNTTVKGKIDTLADVCNENFDIEKLLSISRKSSSYISENKHEPSRLNEREAELRDVNIGVAFDEAFHFYYPDNLEALEAYGCNLVKFSPLKDTALPDGIHALYLGGGYPEEYAGKLANNAGMLESLRRFCCSGHPVYAECGGLMYLSDEIETDEGVFPMAGVLPVGIKMLPRFRSLGYAEVRLLSDSLWGKEGTSVRGHEFHYSELVGSPIGSGWESAYSVTSPRQPCARAAGFLKDNILASYIHLHFASRPEIIENFIQKIEEVL